jgi:hypothetical protein
LILTGEQRVFEDELARTFGPVEAHRLAIADAMCGYSSTWAGPGPRKR